MEVTEKAQCLAGLFQREMVFKFIVLKKMYGLSNKKLIENANMHMGYPYKQKNPDKIKVFVISACRNLLVRLTGLEPVLC